MSVLNTPPTLRKSPRIASAGAAPRLVARPRVVLCDLDGTLIDSMPVLADLASEVMADVYRIPASLARELYVSTCGLPFIRQLEEVFPGDARNQGASNIFEHRKISTCGAIGMTEEVRRTLQRIRDLGVKVVVSSNNGGDNVAAFAQRSGFGFDLV